MDQSLKSFDVAIIDPVGIKGGLDHYNSSLASSLNKSGVSTMVYSNYDGEEFVSKLFPFTFSKSLFNGFKVLNKINKALKQCKEAKCKFVITHVFHSRPSDVVILKLIRSKGFKVCAIIHDAESFIYKSTSLEKLATLTEWLVVHNKHSKEEVVKIVSARNQEKLHVIPHGNYIDLVKDQKHIESIDNKINILFFGMIKKSKGLDLLLNALSKLPEDIHLTIAGRARDVNSDVYKHQIKELDVESRVNLYDRYFTNAERNELFLKSDMIVLPYYKVYQSGVLLLAMSYGLPVIASDLPANREIINDRNGLLFKSGNVDELANAIKKIAFDKALQNNLSLNAKDYVLKNNDWSRIAEKFKNLFSR